MRRKIVIMSLLFAVVFNLTTVERAEARAETVTRVSKQEKMSGDKWYSVITAKTRSGRVVWKYKTKKYIAAEMAPATMQTKGNRVYVFEDRKMLVFHKQTGKRLLKTKKIIDGLQAEFVVDSMGNCYVQPSQMDTVYKISAKGKILWKSNMQKTELYWPAKLRVRNETVRIYYAGFPESYPQEKEAYVDFDKRTGKILRYTGKTER